MITKESGIAYCIPTYNRPSQIEQVLENSLNILVNYGIDVYIYDSSTDDSTQHAVEKYKKQSNLYYFRLPSDVSPIEKVRKIYSGESRSKEYDYIWMVKDRVYSSEELIKKVISAIKKNPDACFLRAIENKYTVNLKCDSYDDPVKFYHDWGWLVTSWDVLLMNKNTILDKMEWDNILEKYLVGNDISFIPVVALFQTIADKNRCEISVLDAPAGRDIIGVPVKSDNRDSKVFDVWGYEWYLTNMRLPDLYNDEKQYVIKTAASLPWLIGDRMRLVNLWHNGYLTDESLSKVKDIWNKISDIPYEELMIIKAGNKEYIEKIYVDTIWEKIEDGNLADAVSDHSQMNWFYDQIETGEGRLTHYVMEIVRLEHLKGEIHIFDGGCTKEYIMKKMDVAITLLRSLEQNDTVFFDQMGATVRELIDKKIISSSMLVYLATQLCTDSGDIIIKLIDFISSDERSNEITAGNCENTIMNENNNSKSSSVVIDAKKKMHNNDKGLINNRQMLCDLVKEECDATIIIVAYNRLDITKKCVENVLKNTNNINYKLLLVYNENEQGEGIMDYYNSVDYNKKMVVHVTENNGAPFAYQQIQKYIEGKYIIHLPNDVIVTSNWLSNLIKCAESDNRIGMVNPVSSNVSNLQCVDLDFKNYEEMQIAAGKYNVSDPLKWFERMRLITLGTLFTRECLSAVGYIFDLGFTHDFGDDDISFRVRRAGYKAVLAADTWVHHAHENVGRKFYDLESGRNCFRDKYFGIDAWDDVNNYIPEITEKIEKPSNTNDIAVLGVDVKCGTPILEIKNKLRSFGIFEPESCAITSEGKYFIDLQTVCGADNVLAGSPDTVSSDFENESFDYIIIGNNINEYPEPLKILKKIYALLKKGGQMYIYLKNTFDVYSFLNVIGYSQVMPTSYAYNFSVEKFAEILESYSIPAELVTCIPYINIPDEYAVEVNKRAESFVKENAGVTQTKLTCDKYLFKLSK